MCLERHEHPEHERHEHPERLDDTMRLEDLEHLEQL